MKHRLQAHFSKKRGLSLGSTLSAFRTRCGIWQFRKTAFTLAEVLITLGIIGVVAALTLPTLIQNHRKSVIETRLKRFYSLINNAVSLAENEHGDRKYWGTVSCNGMTPEQYYNTYFGKHLRNVSTKIEQDSVYTYLIVHFNDGSIVAMKNCYDFFFYPNGKDFSMQKLLLQDEETGAVSRPDAGTKLFTFQFAPARHGAGYNQGVEPYKGALPVGYTREMLTTVGPNSYGCHKDSRYRGYCSTLIQYEGWKIPDDYPFKF